MYRRSQFVLLLGALAAVGSTARPAKEKPNIVMLFVDDLGFVTTRTFTIYKMSNLLYRYGDMGFTGHPTTHTPNIDRLAYQGKILNSWYSGCPVCSGSRTALMTGRQYTRVGVPGVLLV